MTFATRSDLLARSNARRLIQLAVPTDVEMPPDDALRIGIAGGDVSIFTLAEQASLTLALDAIDNALADANDLITSHGIPDTATSTLLARLASTIALYYLQGAERMTDQVSKAYDDAVAKLRQHAKGEINLLPFTAAEIALPEDQVLVSSSPRRYGSTAPDSGWAEDNE